MIDIKTYLVIQITPKIVVDAYTGIEKSETMKKFEDSVIKGSSLDTSKPDVGLINPETGLEIDLNTEVGE